MPETSFHTTYSDRKYLFARAEMHDPDILFEERSDELYPVEADRLFSRKPYLATSFSGVYAAEKR
ncbi:MAG TPA: hypothetical protein DHV29_12695 [Bacteroidales bacterium]|nr:MAG: hypothetical protein A2W94_09110 [Bacteroidetes bacterium GWE2_42_42]HCB62903.1 hypothetical protein [Bacteroidales bacterium]HCY24333.1 hypothetical protein [Bacteroidales bacterium]